MNQKKKAWSWVPSLYFSEGVPYTIVAILSSVMYTTLGVDNATMTLYTSLFLLPWLFKPIWSPFVDIVWTKRKWILCTQLCMALIIVAVACFLHLHDYFLLSWIALMVCSILSATHDIAADGIYIDALDTEAQSFFVGIRTSCYRGAVLLCQGPMIMLAGYLATCENSIPTAWSIVLATIASIMFALAIYHCFALPYPYAPHSAESTTCNTKPNLWSGFTEAFVCFFKKPGVWTALLFFTLYKLPEAQLNKLISPFLLAPIQEGGLGLSTTQVGIAYGTSGAIALISGGIAGGFLVARYGLQRLLMPMAWSMSATCLGFVYLSSSNEPSFIMTNICIALEQFGYGFGGTAYIIYMLQFSKGRYASSHYAIGTGFMTLGTMLPAMASGWIEAQLGYRIFFVWTCICCVATIAVSHAVLNQLQGSNRADA